ncbi:MAG: hypothetical protein ACYCSG_01850 [Thermoplasmataceae archaeon]
MTENKTDKEPDMNQADKLMEKGKFMDSLRILNVLAQKNEGKDEELCEIYGKMSQAYYGLEKFRTDNSLTYMEKCITLREKIGDIPGLALDFMNYAYLLDEKGESPRASESIEKGIEIAKKTGDEQLELTILSARADILSGKKRTINQAMEIYAEVMERSRKIEDWDAYFEAEAGLIKAYRETGNSGKAEEEIKNGMETADRIIASMKTQKQKAEFKEIISYLYDLAVDMALESEDVNRAMELAQKLKNL